MEKGYKLHTDMRAELYSDPSTARELLSTQVSLQIVDSLETNRRLRYKCMYVLAPPMPNTSMFY